MGKMGKADLNRKERKVIWKTKTTAIKKTDLKTSLIV